MRYRKHLFLIWHMQTQRLLATLAWHGALSRSEAFAAARYTNRKSLTKLMKAGIVVCWRYPKRGSSARVIVALNDGHPAMSELRALLRSLVSIDLVPLPTCARTKVGHAPKRSVPSKKLALVFGPTGASRYKFLTLLEALGGTADLSALARGLPEIAPQTLRKFAGRFTRMHYLRKAMVGKQSIFSYDERAKGTRELRALCCRLLKDDPEIKRRVKLARTKEPQETYQAYGGAVPYLRGAIGALRPIGLAPPASLAPLLFGSDARYRILATLALCGPCRVTQLQRLSHSGNYAPVKALRNCGLVLVQGRVPRRVIGLHVGFPAYEELRTLLMALHKRYPVLTEAVPPSGVLMRRHHGEWGGTIEQLCVTPLRTKVLISIGNSGGIDNSSLSRLFPEHAPCDLRQALHMFTAFGVFERYKEGTALMYRLNPKFCAFAPLRRLLRRLGAEWPQYGYRTRLEERYMSPSRLVMRRNARRALKQSKKARGTR